MKTREKLLTVEFEPEGRRVRVSPGITILQAASEAGISIRSECGGKGDCGKCKVIIQDKNAVTEITDAEVEHLSSWEIGLSYRLACCTILKQNVIVIVPKESRIGVRKIQITGLERPVPLNPLVKKLHVILPKPTLSDVRSDSARLLDYLKDVHGFDRLDIDYELLKELPGVLRDADWNVTVVIWGNHRVIAVEPGNTSDKLFGLAIDIGTSKIALYVVDLTTGKTVDMRAVENPQVIHGEDIISRITYATSGNKNLESLQKLVVEAINDILRDVCIEANVDPNNIYEATMVGNTAMHHFFLAIQPEYVAISPFTPATRGPINVRAKELNIEIHPDGVIHTLPVIAGFVGADAVGDILATGVYESGDLSLLLDIGTNTEILLGNAEDILSCSCASGPAFEGGHIKYGMKAVTGAIEKVRINPDSYEVEYKTVGGVKPIGICGSAIVDIVAELLKCGIINGRGRFNPNLKTPRFKITDQGTKFILAWKDETGINKEITVTQEDITEIQLAKAAIFTGCSILMKRKDVEKEDLNRVFIAGAFGSYINPENAKFIGLVPDVPTKKIEIVGNTAITGAKMALISREARELAETLSKKVRYLELSADPEFSREFSSGMFIPHRDLDRFPSVNEYFDKLGKRSLF